MRKPDAQTRRLVPRPFDLESLVGRVKAWLRPAPAVANSMAGDVTIPPPRVVRRAGAEAAPVPRDRDQGRGRMHWLGLQSARTRILASYLVLLALSAVVALFALQQVLLIRVDDQVHDALEQEVRELDRLFSGVDPATGEPFASLEALFDVYLRRNVPSNDEALLAYVDGELYRTAVVRFPLDQLPAETMDEWEALSGGPLGEPGSATGEFTTVLGKGEFRATRIRLGDHVGAFVVTILPAEEYREIAEIQRYGVAGTLATLMIASAGAWFFTGRVLAPVRLLTETARRISQSDLTGRIEVRGSDEAAEMARSFNAMLDRLEAVFRSQREFVRDASHELRDPLTIVGGHLELISDDPEERKKTVALVIDEIDRMGRIVDDLQLLADTEQPDFLQPAWVDAALFSHELTAKASALASRRWKLDAGADGIFYADRHRLTEAVMNLAHNAVQHTLPNDTIAIGMTLDERQARLWVRDTGFGIPAAEQGRIFHRFTRGKGAHRRYRGSGLGLAIVKAIAESHGGRVELESNVGEGSQFTTVIPRYPTDGGDHGSDPDR
jgi:two-component system OmpR family sensor kinase